MATLSKQQPWDIVSVTNASEAVALDIFSSLPAAVL